MANPALHAPSSLTSRTRTREIVLIFLAILVALGGSALIGATQYGLFVFGGVLAALGGIIVLLQPAVGLYFLYLFIFSNASTVLEISFGVPDLNKYLIALIFVGTLANRVVLLKKPLIFGLTEIAVMLYGGAVVASLFVTSDANTAVKEVVNWLKDFVIFLIIVQFGTEEQAWKRTQWVLILAAATLGTFNAYQMVTRNFEANFMGFANSGIAEITSGYDSQRITGPLDDPNMYGMIQLMVLPVAFYRYLTDESPRNRMVGLVASIFIMLAVISSFSRGAFIALAVVGVLILRERRFNLVKVAAVMVFIVTVIVPFMPRGFVDRILTLSSLFSTAPSQQTEGSLRGRSSEAIVAFQMFRDYPVLGIGRGHYAKNYIPYAAGVGLDDRYEERQAHSLYLEVAAETGIVGVVTFGVMIFVLFRGMKQAIKVFRQINRPDLVHWVMGVQYGLLAYMLASIFLHGDYIRYFWLIVGLAASSSVLAQALRMRLSDSRIVSRISPIT